MSEILSIVDAVGKEVEQSPIETVPASCGALLTSELEQESGAAGIFIQKVDIHKIEIIKTLVFRYLHRLVNDENSRLE